MRDMSTLCACAEPGQLGGTPAWHVLSGAQANEVRETTHECSSTGRYADADALGAKGTGTASKGDPLYDDAPVAAFPVQGGAEFVENENAYETGPGVRLSFVDTERGESITQGASGTSVASAGNEYEYGAADDARVTGHTSSSAIYAYSALDDPRLGVGVGGGVVSVSGVDEDENEEGDNYFDL